MNTDLNIRIAFMLTHLCSAQDGTEIAPEVIQNYAGDLNLMRKLEMCLKDNEWSDYMDELQEGMQLKRVALVHAPAAQKARAWLKVKEASR